MKFVKMEGAGNDFILFNGDMNKEFLNSKNFKKGIINICDRHFGIGSDGLMFTGSSVIADIKMNYYNSDGSIAELCGNGIRCFAKFVYEENILKKKEFDIETLAGTKRVKLSVLNNIIENVTVNIGKPVFEPEMIPTKTEKQQNKGKVVEEVIEIGGQEIKTFSVRVGVPHTVIFINNIKDIDIGFIGKKIENHSFFPEKTNVNFVQIKNRSKIDLYTWERGVGRTLACGTGACAAVVAGVNKDLLNNKIIVKTEGGELRVEIKNKKDIFLTGEVKTVYRGIIENRKL